MLFMTQSFCSPPIRVNFSSDAEFTTKEQVGNKKQPTIYAPVAGRDVLHLFQHSGAPKKYKTKRPLGQVDDHKLINIFGFGMSLDHVVPLRRGALGHILKRTNLRPQVIQEIKRDFTGNGDFLISLLGNDTKKEIVLSIYASPYIAWKLEAAGFVIDPCCLDGSGLSAFYHSMGLDSTLLLHVLYDYASNNFEHSDSTTRNPDQDILRALIKIGRTLRNDCLKSTGFLTLGDKKDIAFKSYEEILSFNEYQRLVVQGITDQQQILSPKVSLSDDGNVIKRKHIITSLMSLYPKYFYFPNVNKVSDCVAGKNEFCKFQDFIQYSEYYENLDNYSCLLFFDNFLFLDLPDDVMNSAVQNLFLTVFGYSLFPKCKHGVHCTRHVPTPEEGALRVIPFIFRSKFLESSKVVLQKLKPPSPDGASESPERQSRKKHDPNSVLLQVRSGLKDRPEIMDEFLIGRLKNYLKVACHVEISDVDMKGISTVERALQVVGEALNTSERESVFGHLLCSCLEGVDEELFRIRNRCLSHYRHRSTPGKQRSEKNIKIFKEIQDMLKAVHSAIEPVYESQRGRILYYMVERGLHGSENVDVTLAQNMKSEYKSVNSFLVKFFIINKGRYKGLANNLLKYIEREAGKEKCSKARKIGQISTLEFLFNFLANKCGRANRDAILLILQDSDRLSKAFESKTNTTKSCIEIEILPSESQEILRIVSGLRKITESIFSEVKYKPTQNIDSSVVKKFFNDARRFSWFTSKEMSEIKEKISQRLRMSQDAKAPLNDYLLKRGLLSEPEAQQLVVEIFASQKVKSRISMNLSSGNYQTALKDLRSVKKNDQNVFKATNDQEDDIDCLIRFTKTEEGIHLLLKMEFPDDLHRKVLEFLNREIKFLLDRIGHLKSILIEEDEEILNLWKWGKSKAIKTHTRFLMCQRYRREREVQMSLEMLLFDCMNILWMRPSLSRLWSKANDLFSGANLRNILSHGSPILEMVGGCLDEDDLPSHFIDKMLELIEDGDALKTLSDLWEKEITDLTQFENRLTANDPSLSEVQKWMKKRPGSVGGWKDYLTLLPLK